MLLSCVFDKRGHHIPDAYVDEPIDGAVIWTSASSEPHWNADIGRVVEEALASVGRLLEFRRTRSVHVVVYDSLEDSRIALGRTVPPGFLLAPLHTPHSAVIAAHSPRLDPINGDRVRMLRQLCHEVSHVCAAERTSSVKRLGDNDAGMRIRPWVDEGFAVCVAARASHQPEALERTLAVDTSTVSPDRIDDELRALQSPRRAAAFSVATARVWTAIQREGFRFVFDRLDTPESWS